jgi:hypothetical protein
MPTIDHMAAAVEAAQEFLVAASKPGAEEDAATVNAAAAFVAEAKGVSPAMVLADAAFCVATGPLDEGIHDRVYWPYRQALAGEIPDADPVGVRQKFLADVAGIVAAMDQADAALEEAGRE